MDFHTHGSLAAVLVLRTALATISLSLLLTLVQLLRLGPVLAELGLSAFDLGRVGALVLPAIVTVALPAGLLIASLVTFREQSLRRAWLLWRCSGVSLRTVGTLLTAVGLAASIPSGVCAAWAGPTALDTLAGTLERSVLISRLSRSPGVPVLIGGDTAMACDAATQSPVTDGSTTLDHPWLVRADRSAALLVVADTASWRGDSVTLRGAEVWAHRAASGDRPAEEVHGRHREVALELPAAPKPATQAGWTRYLPETERLNAAELIDHAQDSTTTVASREATTALSKRVALVLAPLLLILLAFPLAAPTAPASVGSGHHLSALTLLGLSASFFALMRTGEILAHGGGPTWLPFALPLGVLGLVCGWLWIRLRRTW